MEFGVHLPQIALDEPTWTLDGLVEYAEAVEGLGYAYLCANDHLVFPRPWLDGPTALSALLDHTGLRLATTISLPVVRGPVALAKTLAALDDLSGGRLTVGLGPGSSERDYEAVGVPFDERWPRFDESIRALRSLWDPSASFEGEYYSPGDATVEPLPAQPGGPPVWIGSWGSPVGLRRVARLGDGWLASGYNTTPERFAEGRHQLDDELRAGGRGPEGFPDGIATMFFHVTDDEADARRVVRDRLAPALGRPAETLAECLPIGSIRECTETLAAYREAGVQRVYLWPVQDELDQLRTFSEQVAPGVS